MEVRVSAQTRAGGNHSQATPTTAGCTPEAHGGAGARSPRPRPQAGQGHPSQGHEFSWVHRTRDDRLVQGHEGPEPRAPVRRTPTGWPSSRAAVLAGTHHGSPPPASASPARGTLWQSCPETSAACGPGRQAGRPQGPGHAAREHSAALRARAGPTDVRQAGSPRTSVRPPWLVIPVSFPRAGGTLSEGWPPGAKRAPGHPAVSCILPTGRGGRKGLQALHLH